MGNTQYQSNISQKRKLGGFTDLELEQYHNIFNIQLSQDGLLDKIKLRSMLKFQTTEIDKIFEFFDLNFQNRVDQYQFFCGLQQIRQMHLEEKGALIFSIYSANDQMLHKLEFQHWVLTLQSLRSEVLNLKAKSLKEIQAIVDLTYKNYDLNNDDFLSKDEFLQIFLHDQEYLDFFQIIGVLTSEDLLYSQNFSDFEKDKDIIQELNLQKLYINPVYQTKMNSTCHLPIGVDHELQAQITKAKQITPEQISKNPTYPPLACSLEFVYGFRSQDCRSNLLYTKQGAIVYVSGSVVVVYDQNTNTSHFYSFHTANVLCITITQDTIASGQSYPNPSIHIYKAFQLTPIHILPLPSPAFHLSYSKYDHLAVCTAETLYVYSEEHKIAEGALSFNRVLDVFFDEDGIMTVAPQGMVFYTVNSLLKTLEGQVFSRQTAICIFTLDQLSKYTWICGNHNGSINIYREKELLFTPNQAHKGAVLTFAPGSDPLNFFSGGADGMVHEWVYQKEDDSIRLVTSYYISESPILQNNIQVVGVRSLGDQLIVGTRNGEIVEYRGQKSRLLVCGHFGSEVKGAVIWGKTTEQKTSDKPIYTYSLFTIGEEGLVIAWDLEHQKMLKRQETGYTLECVAIDPSAKYLAVGCRDGHILILNPENLQIIHKIKNPKEIGQLLFTSDSSSLLACLAPPSNFINLYTVPSFTLSTTLGGSAAQLLSLDLSQDNSVLITSNSNHQCLFYDLKQKKQKFTGEVDYKDTLFSTWKNRLGWQMAGIWDSYRDLSEITCVERGGKQANIVCVGDRYGRLRFWRWPAIVKDQGYIEIDYLGASVKSIAWSHDRLAVVAGHSVRIYKFNEWEEIEAFSVKTEVPVEKQYLYDQKRLTVKQQVNRKIKNQTEGYDPFESVALNKPKAFKQLDYQDNLPIQTLEIAHVYGVKMTLNGVSFGPKGEILYMSSCYPILLNPDSKQQTLLQGHTEGLVCMAVHPKTRSLLATAQKPSLDTSGHYQKDPCGIYLWNLQHPQHAPDILPVPSPHSSPVALTFSPYNHYLLFLSTAPHNPHHHYISLYDTALKTLLITHPLFGDTIHEVAFSGAFSFISAGYHHLTQWTFTGASLIPASFQPDHEFIPTPQCLVFYNNLCYTGHKSGEIGIWENRIYKKGYMAHEGGVTCLVQHGGLFSGGMDGKVVKWVLKGMFLQQEKVMCDLGQGVGIVSFAFHEGQMVVGTELGDLWLEQNSKWSIIVHQLVTPPQEGIQVVSSPEYYALVSLGGDKKFKLWDTKENKLKATTQEFHFEVLAVEWSSDGSLLVASDRNGMLFLLDPHSLLTIEKHQSKLKDVDILTLSPENKMLAIASSLQPTIQIFLLQHKALNEFGILQSPPLLSLTWNLSSEYLMANTLDYSVLYYSLSTLDEQYSMTPINNTTFKKPSLISWQTQGIFSDESFLDIVTLDHADHWMATGYKDYVDVLTYPVIKANAQRRRYFAHPGGVSSLCLSFDKTQLITLGAKDQCMIKWNVLGVGQPQDLPSEILYQYTQPLVLQKHTEKYGLYPPLPQPAVQTIDRFRPRVENIQVKPKIKQWTFQVQPPKKFLPYPAMSSSPNSDLTLVYTYGYNSYNYRNCIIMINAFTLAYPCGSLVVLLNINDLSQKYFNQHQSEVSCLALHPDRTKFVSAEIGTHPNIYIVGIRTLAVESHLSGPKEGITHLVLSDRGRYLLVSSLDHTFTLYDLHAPYMPPKVIPHPSAPTPIIISSLCFFGESEFYHLGLNHFQLYSMDTNKHQTFPAGIVTSAVVSVPYLFLGLHSGVVEFYREHGKQGSARIHTGMVSSMVVHQYLYTGGVDKKVIITNTENLSVIVKLDIGAQVKSLVVNDKVFIGTEDKILEYEIEGEINKLTRGKIKQILVSSHLRTKDQKLFGLCMIPSSQNVVTVGDDGWLRVWDGIMKRPLLTHQFNHKSLNKGGQSLPLYYQGKSVGVVDGFIIVGFADGSCRSFRINGNYESLTEQHCWRDSHSWINCITVSPNRKSLAMGSFDKKIYLYALEVQEQELIVTLEHVLEGHSGEIMAIDFSINSLYIQSTCIKDELWYWDCKMGKKLKEGIDLFKDEPWHTWTQTIGWPVQGIWQQNMKDHFINSTARSNFKHPQGYHLLAKADDYHNVSIYKYPSLEEGSECIVGKGHSSFVSKVVWTYDDTYLFSIGGQDQILMQWQCLNK